MNSIKLITPPDKLYTQELSFLLVHPNSIIKSDFQDLISKVDIPIHVYLFEDQTDDNIDWLFEIFHQVNIVILDVDNCPPKVRDLTSYFITKDKTYWLTNSGENYYNKLSRNRIFTLDALEHIVGGNIETQPQR
jgi:hypothetical protein